MKYKRLICVQMITDKKLYLDVVKVLFFRVKNIKLYLFYFYFYLFSCFGLRIRVSIILYIIVTNYHTIIEGHRRFQNNDIILYIDSI